MGTEKILRPEAKEVKAMIAEAVRIDEGLREIQNTDNDHRATAQKAAQALYDERIKKALEQIDVEHVNRSKQGLRVSLLRNNGIENVWQLSQMTFQQLCDIDGLGDQSARKILDTVESIVENTKETARIRIHTASLRKLRADARNDQEPRADHPYEAALARGYRARDAHIRPVA